MTLDERSSYALACLSADAVQSSLPAPSPSSSRTSRARRSCCTSWAPRPTTRPSPITPRVPRRVRTPTAASRWTRRATPSSSPFPRRRGGRSGGGDAEALVGAIRSDRPAYRYAAHRPGGLHRRRRPPRSAHCGHGVMAARSFSRARPACSSTVSHRPRRAPTEGHPEAVPIFQLGYGSFPPLKTISNTNLPRPAARSSAGRRATGGAVAIRGRRPSRDAHRSRRHRQDAARDRGRRRRSSPSTRLASSGSACHAARSCARHRDDRPDARREGRARRAHRRAGDAAPARQPRAGHRLPRPSFPLLASCPNLTLLVTSRELLRIQAEVEYAVPPLAEQEAVELFCARSSSDRRRWSSAAAWTTCHWPSSWPPLARTPSLQRRSSSGSPSASTCSRAAATPIRASRRSSDHRVVVRPAFPEEQQVFARLSVFAGGCTLEAAEEVADADPTSPVAGREEPVRFTDGRYWMLETIREYAAEQLERSGDQDGAKQRLAEFILKLASQLEATFASGGGYGPFAAEQDNFRVALAWAERERELTQLDLIGRSWPFWWYRGHPAEGLRWVASALGRSEGERTVRRVKVLTAGAMFAYRAGDLLYRQGVCTGEPQWSPQPRGRRKPPGD